MTVTGFDHIVLSCLDVASVINFYRDHFGMTARQDRPGKWALHFGSSRISLQNDAEKPDLASGTLPGTGNFCLISEEPVGALAERLRAAGIDILEGPGRKDGATGPIWSIYFRDPEGNLVEVANRL